MRIKITFSTKAGNFMIPINYNHILTSLIYNILQKSSYDYSTFLHDSGYSIGKRHLKLFVFSNLFFKTFEMKDYYIHSSSKIIEWYVSSMVEEFIMNFTKGLLRGMSYVDVNPQLEKLIILIKFSRPHESASLALKLAKAFDIEGASLEVIHQVQRCYGYGQRMDGKDIEYYHLNLTISKTSDILSA